MATKGPTELELSVLPGYKHPIKSLHSLRKDLMTINQLSNTLKNYKLKKDIQLLKRSLNLIIILSNVFEPPTLEYAIYATLSNDLWPEAATLLFALKLSGRRNYVDDNLISMLEDLKQSR
jgi:hypothetical protein